MTPVERLQAAIEKLEKQRTETDPVRDDSAWVVDYVLDENICRVIVMDSHNNGFDGWQVAETTTDAHAQLIATLHRTIDAQLAFMNHAVKFLGSVGHGTSSIAGPFIDDALALADAIFGGNS